MTSQTCPKTPTTSLPFQRHVLPIRAAPACVASLHPAAAPLMRLCKVHFINLQWKERRQQRRRRRRTDGISRSAKSLRSFQWRDNNDSLLCSEITVWIYRGNFPQELNKSHDGWTIRHQHLMAARWCKQCNPCVLNFGHFSSPHRGRGGGDPLSI